MRCLIQQIIEWSGKRPENRHAFICKSTENYYKEAGRRQCPTLSRSGETTLQSGSGTGKKGRVACFPLSASRSVAAHSNPRPSEAEQVLDATDVMDLRSLSLLRRQRKTDMPTHFQTAIGRVGGAYRANRQNLRETAKLLAVTAQIKIQYPGADKAGRATRQIKFTDELGMTMLRNNCFRQVRAWASTNSMLQTTSLSTPQTELELAEMLRDPSGILRCPFGTDFEEQSCVGTRMDRGHRIPFWLAFVELHSDGYRYSYQSDQNLPYVFEKVVDLLTSKRQARQETSQAGSTPCVGVSDDLTDAFVNNSVVRHKIAAHDLLTYARKDLLEHLWTITTEQLQHGGMMTPSGLMPTTAAKLIADSFFDFLLKHTLMDTTHVGQNES